MKKELLSILVCPVCKQELEIEINEEDKKEIISGSLHCCACDILFPIADAIPNMLLPEQRS